MAWTGRISLFTSGGHVCRLPVTAVHSPGITDFSPRDTLADLHVTFDRSIIKWKCNTLLIICCT